MILTAAAVFAADILAVGAIVGSLWLERSLGLSRGYLLDWIFIIAVSFGTAGWVAGKLLERKLFAGKGRQTEAPAIEHARAAHVHPSK